VILYVSGGRISFSGSVVDNDDTRQDVDLEEKELKPQENIRDTWLVIEP
jgi:hypothetical protein